MADNLLEAFITSIIESKLEHTFMLVWQDYSHASREVPPYETLLEFLDRCARATENTLRESERKCLGMAPERRIFSRPSYIASVEKTCMACKSAKHPLYVCRAFKGFSHSKKLELMRENGLYLNCLKPRHFTNQCPCTQKCKKCQKPHHSWLHIDQPNEAKETITPATEREVTHVSQLMNCQQVLLMTCQVLVVAPESSTSRLRAQLDSASFASFITEHLTQRLRLLRRHHGIKISGIGGATSELALRRTVQCGITRVRQWMIWLIIDHWLINWSLNLKFKIIESSSRPLNLKFMRLMMNDIIDQRMIWLIIDHCLISWSLIWLIIDWSLIIRWSTND